MVERLRGGQPAVPSTPPAEASGSPGVASPPSALRAGATARGRVAGPSDAFGPSGAAGSRTALPRAPGPRAKQLDPANLPTNPVQAALQAEQIGRWNREGALLVTAASVERVLDSKDLSSITPAIPKHLWPLAEKLTEALGPAGPLGSRGPLSPRGPLGRSAINPSFWMKTLGDWSGLAATLTGLGGPGSGRGSLGNKGPLAKESYELLLPNLPPLGKQLQAGGLYAALGPLGPLSALGALGYLGVVGGHGFAQNANGEFVSKDGAVQRTTDVVYGGEKRTYELVEFYSEEFARAMPDNDTSWMVRGKVEPGSPDTFAFTSRSDQFVTLAVVPERADDVFHLEFLDDRGEVVARSDSMKAMNWIQVQVDAGRKLQARVVLADSDEQAPRPHPASLYVDAVMAPLLLWGEAMRPALEAAGHRVDKVEKNAYRLFTVGSGEHIADSDIGGDHQTRFCWIPASPAAPEA